VAALVFDAGGLIALDRGDRRVGVLLAAAAEDGVEVVTSSACVAQAWRNPVRQVRLVRALAGFLECSFDATWARRSGLLLAGSRTRDVVDAAISLLVQDGDTIITSDPEDINRLLQAAGTDARVLTV
jgi:hypothetical protein